MKGSPGSRPFPHDTSESRRYGTLTEKAEIGKVPLLCGLALEGFLGRQAFFWGHVLGQKDRFINDAHRLECVCVGGDRCVPGMGRVLQQRAG